MRVAWAVEDSLVEFDGLTPQMLEALAKDGVKTLEDFATCADWELAGGWTQLMANASKMTASWSSSRSLWKKRRLVMTARIMLGWVDPAELETRSKTQEATSKRRPRPDLRPRGIDDAVAA